MQGEPCASVAPSLGTLPPPWGWASCRPGAWPAVGLAVWAGDLSAVEGRGVGAGRARAELTGPHGAWRPGVSASGGNYPWVLFSGVLEARTEFIDSEMRVLVSIHNFLLLSK